MPLFFVRLVSNRPNFALSMTVEEQAVMRQHVGWLQTQLAAGRLVVAGPVVDPTGVFGMGVFEEESLEAAKALIASDPANAVGRYEISPMGPNTVRRPPA